MQAAALRLQAEQFQPYAKPRPASSIASYGIHFGFLVEGLERQLHHWLAGYAHPSLRNGTWLNRSRLNRSRPQPPREQLRCPALATQTMSYPG